MLEIRRINAEEAADASKVAVVSFNDRHDYSKGEEPNEFKFPDHWTWAAFEGGRPVSVITEIPYVMRFDGHDAKMSGIGGVATLPEARYGGKIQNIFAALLRGAYADGVIFSCLAPFSHAFYRKVGYELCCSRREIRLPTAELSKLRTPAGSHEQIFPGGDTSALQRVHSAFISDLNHGIRRDVWPDNIAWRSFTKNDPYNTGNFIYLWRDAAGEPRGYIKYQHRRSGENNEADISELAYADREALYAQLAFLGKLSAAIKSALWSAPLTVEPADFVEVAWDVSQRISPRDMTRVVNVKAALELMRVPGGEGAFVIETNDPIIPENSGRWLVEYGPCARNGDESARGPADVGGAAPSHARNRVAATEKDADLACDMPVFAQLVTGYRAFDDILATSRGYMEARGDTQTLRKVFTQRPQLITEYF